MISGFERFLKSRNPIRALLQLGLIVSHEFCLQLYKYCFKFFCPELVVVENLEGWGHPDGDPSLLGHGCD